MLQHFASELGDMVPLRAASRLVQLFDIPYGFLIFACLSTISIWSCSMTSQGFESSQNLYVQPLCIFLRYSYRRFVGEDCRIIVAFFSGMKTQLIAWMQPRRSLAHYLFADVVSGSWWRPGFAWAGVARLAV
jgi:hypothetical protein